MHTVCGWLVGYKETTEGWHLTQGTPQRCSCACHGSLRRTVVSFTWRPLYFRCRSPRYPLNGGLGGPYSRPAVLQKMKDSCHCMELNPDSSVVTIATALRRLRMSSITTVEQLQRYKWMLQNKFCYKRWSRGSSVSVVNRIQAGKRRRRRTSDGSIGVFSTASKPALRLL